MSSPPADLNSIISFSREPFLTGSDLLVLYSHKTTRFPLTALITLFCCTFMCICGCMRRVCPPAPAPRAQLYAA